MRDFVRPLLGVALIAAIGAVVFLSMYERVEETVPAPASGKLRTNPYVVPERFLHHMGLPVRTVAALSSWPLPASGTAVIWLTDVDENAPLPEGAGEWIRSGGHLVWGAALPKDGKLDDRFLMDSLRTMTLVRPDKDTTQIVSEGRLTLLAEPSRLRNTPALEDDNLAALWATLDVAPAPKRAFLVVWPASPSLLVLLWEHAKMVLIAGFVLVLVWISRSAVRLGPLASVSPPVRRSMVEHIRAAGVMTWRTASTDRVLEQSRTRLRERIDAKVRRDPSMDEARWHREIAEKSGLQQEDVAAALRTPITDRRSLTRCMQAQQALEEAL